jgi:hypothetical protein
MLDVKERSGLRKELPPSAFFLANRLATVVATLTEVVAQKQGKSRWALGVRAVGNLFGRL